jgi:hypothetical protein
LRRATRYSPKAAAECDRFERTLAMAGSSGVSDKVETAIQVIRGERVLLDKELATLYCVTTKALNQAVRRNKARFPIDFMFQLTAAETRALRLRSQTVTLKRGRHRKYRPFAFTEQGVAMLSSVLRSPRAIAVNVAIIRVFVRLRRLAGTHADLALRLSELEAKYDARFKVVFNAIRRLMEPPEREPPRTGFRPEMRAAPVEGA